MLRLVSIWSFILHPMTDISVGLGTSACQPERSGSEISWTEEIYKVMMAAHGDTPVFDPNDCEFYGSQVLVSAPRSAKIITWHTPQLLTPSDRLTSLMATTKSILTLASTIAQWVRTICANPIRTNSTSVLGIISRSTGGTKMRRTSWTLPREIILHTRIQAGYGIAGVIGSVALSWVWWQGWRGGQKDCSGLASILRLSVVPERGAGGWLLLGKWQARICCSCLINMSVTGDEVVEIIFQYTVVI